MPKTPSFLFFKKSVITICGASLICGAGVVAGIALTIYAAPNIKAPHDQVIISFNASDRLCDSLSKEFAVAKIHGSEHELEGCTLKSVGQFDGRVMSIENRKNKYLTMKTSLIDDFYARMSHSERRSIGYIRNLIAEFVNG